MLDRVLRAAFLATLRVLGALRAPATRLVALLAAELPGLTVLVRSGPLLAPSTPLGGPVAEPARLPARPVAPLGSLCVLVGLVGLPCELILPAGPTPTAGSLPLSALLALPAPAALLPSVPATPVLGGLTPVADPVPLADLPLLTGLASPALLVEPVLRAGPALPGLAVLSSLSALAAVASPLTTPPVGLLGSTELAPVPGLCCALGSPLLAGPSLAGVPWLPVLLVALLVVLSWLVVRALLERLASAGPAPLPGVLPLPSAVLAPIVEPALVAESASPAGPALPAIGLLGPSVLRLLRPPSLPMLSVARVLRLPHTGCHAYRGRRRR